MTRPQCDRRSVKTGAECTHSGMHGRDSCLVVEHAAHLIDEYAFGGFLDGNYPVALPQRREEFPRLELVRNGEHRASSTECQDSHVHPRGHDGIEGRQHGL
jgi:hypothetical protein